MIEPYSLLRADFLEICIKQFKELIVIIFMLCFYEPVGHHDWMNVMVIAEYFIFKGY